MVASDILVLGATGFTGRLITRYLHNHPQRTSFTFALGVRSKSKGEELKRSLGIDDSVTLVQVDFSSYDNIEAAVKDTKVVINLVGPYWTWGADVVRACAVHGKRYVDLAGEPHFIKKIADRYDHLATTRGAIIVNTCGFDSIPADILVFLSNKTLKNALGSSAQLGLSQTFYDVRGGLSGGTFATMMNDIEVVPRLRIIESSRDYALSHVRGHPSPRPQLSTPVPFSSPSLYGTFFPMASANRAIVHRTFGLNALTASYAHILSGMKDAKRDAELQLLTYGPEFRYAEYFVLPAPYGRSRLAAILVGMLLQLYLGLMFSVTPVRWLVKRFLPKSGEGPSESAMAKGYMNVTNYTQCSSAPGTVVKSVMRGDGDPGYLLTASMIAESALGLLLDDASLPSSARLGGVLTPATALGDVLIRRLEATGTIRFESEILSSGAVESKKQR
ncbi:Saccharopine dehydrogenase-domain-containing protein [Daedaleopsis nitida]|nr:Saccharopine dehydrogenase-domain-containing protein [Daedaleopsis nitida]